MAKLRLLQSAAARGQAALLTKRQTEALAADASADVAITPGEEARLDDDHATGASSASTPPSPAARCWTDPS